jgi:hypothetical protein
MRIDRVTIEGLCTCGFEIEIDSAPDPKKNLPMLTEIHKKCKNEECRRSYHIHMQEILPII